MEASIKYLRSQQIGTRTKVGYGVAEAGIVAAEVLIQLYLLKFWVSEVKLAPALAGTALALAVLWDAFTDPLMGALSDRTRSVWGRRRPYLIGGGVLLAITLPLLFAPVGLEGQSTKFAYLLFSYILVNTATTILAVPHAALGGELDPDVDGRTESFGYRLFFGNLGLLAGTLLPGLLLVAALAADHSRFAAALAVSVIVLATAVVSFRETHGCDQVLPPRSSRVPRSVWPSLRFLFSNRAFVVLLAAFFIATAGRTINSSIALYYYEEFIGLSEQHVVLVVLGVFILVIGLSILAWIHLARQFGKKRPAFWGVLLLGLGTCLSYPFFPRESFVGPVIAAILGGFLVASIFLFDALVADIVDYDELRTGERREGLYFVFWKLSAKTSRALGLALSGFALSFIGYDAQSSEQASDVSQEIAIMFGPGVGVLFIIAALLFLNMRWNESIHSRVLTILHRKRGKTGGLAV